MDLLDLLHTGGKGNNFHEPDEDARAFRAASLGKLEILIRHCERGADMNKHHNGFTCLHTACKKNHPHIVDYLLQNYSNHSLESTEGGKNCIDVCKQLSNDGRTPWMIAAFEGNSDILRLLTEHACQSIEAAQFDINACDTAGNTALHHCCFGGSVVCAKYLIEQCAADHLLKNKEGMLPIQFAAAGNHVDLVSYLHKLPASNKNKGINGEDDAYTDSTESGINSLHRAAMHGSLETLQMLIDEKIISSDSTMPNLNTALHLASQRGMSNIVDYLINHPSIELDINAQNEFGLAPLHFACIGGYSDIVAKLLEHGAIPSLLTVSESTPLHLAASSGSHEVCDMLVNCKAKINIWAEDSDGMTAIDMALNSSYKKLASRLAEWAYIEDRTQRIIRNMNFLAS